MNTTLSPDSKVYGWFRAVRNWGLTFVLAGEGTNNIRLNSIQKSDNRRLTLLPFRMFCERSGKGKSVPFQARGAQRVPGS